MRQIDPKTTVNQLLMDHPTVISTLNELGVDACCGGASTLEEVSVNDGIELEALLSALERTIEGTESPNQVRSLQ